MRAIRALAGYGQMNHLMGVPQTIPGPVQSKAAFSRYIARVTPASIVERTVPTASPPPAAPGDVIAILAVGISRFPGRTIDALAWAGYHVTSHRGSCQHRKKNCGNANQLEFLHAFLLLLPVMHNTKYGREYRTRARRESARRDLD